MGFWCKLFAKDTIQKEEEVHRFSCDKVPYVNTFRLGEIVEQLKEYGNYKGAAIGKGVRLPFEESSYCREQFVDLDELCRQIREYCEYSNEVAFKMHYIPIDSSTYSSPVTVLWYLHNNKTNPAITFEIF